MYPPCNPHPPRPPTTPARALPTAFQSFDTQRSQATRHCGDHHHHHCDLLLPDHYHNHHPRNPPFPCYPLATFVEFDDRFDDTDLLNGNAVQTFTNFPFNPGYSTRNFDDYFPKVHHPLPSNEYVAKDRVFRPLDRSQFYRSTGIFIHSNCIANFLKPSSTERLYRGKTREWNTNGTGIRRCIDTTSSGLRRETRCPDDASTSGQDSMDAYVSIRRE